MGAPEENPRKRKLSASAKNISDSASTGATAAFSITTKGKVSADDGNLNRCWHCGGAQQIFVMSLVV
jgi:hypothetical protein